MAHAKRQRRRLWADLSQSTLGMVVLSLGLWALVRDVEAWNVVWYVPAWYGYLLLLDAVTHALGGVSLVRERPRELLAMMFWSVPFWFVFELFNLALRNWYYVYLLRTEWLQLVFSWLAFATVFPACFCHAHLARTLGWFAGRRSESFTLGRGARITIAVVGLGSIVAPLVWPRYTFWLIWGAPFWLPELLNRRSGAPSLLRDLERGRPARAMQLLAGGLLAGFVWEMLNYGARSKWIYTVPGLEDWKLFEMPFLGFVGFPVLALGAYSTYALIGRLLRDGRYWDEPAGERSRGTHPVRWGVGVAAAIALSFLAFVTAVDHTARSRRPLLSEIATLTESDRGLLRQAGLGTPEHLHRAVVSEGVGPLAARTAIDRTVLERAAEQATLALHKGMGAPTAGLLLDAGVRQVSDLVEADADELWHRLRTAARSRGLEPPRRAEVRVWIRAASPAGTPRR